VLIDAWMSGNGTGIGLLCCWFHVAHVWEYAMPDGCQTAGGSWRSSSLIGFAIKAS
jgi:hypothetical protein